MKTKKEFEEEIGEEPDGLVAKYVNSKAEDGKYIVRVPTGEVKINRLEDSSVASVSIVGELFESLFEEFPDNIDSGDISINIEVDQDKFHDEWVIACEQTNGAFYLLKEEEVEEDRKKFVPEIIDKTEKEDQQLELIENEGEDG